MKTIGWHKNFYIVASVDSILNILSLYLSYKIRFGMLLSSPDWDLFIQCLPIVMIVKFIFFYTFDLYHGMWRYTSITDLANIIKAATFSTISIVFILLLSTRFEGFSRSVFIIDWLLTIFLIAGFRVIIRWYFEDIKEGASFGVMLQKLINPNGAKRKDQKRLLIIGAGGCAEKIYREIRDNGELQYRVVGFLDDAETKIGLKIHGIPVLGKIENIERIASKFDADEALIAIPSAKSEDMRRVVDCCKASGIPFKTVPSMGELIDGRISINSIREVAYSDLLGREVIRLDEKTIGSYLRGQCVMVTGAGGSIGSELCRQICRFRPKTLILFERGETQLYEIEMELRCNYPHIDIIPLLADIQDRYQVDHAFQKYKPLTVFHAAAYKHVPMLEIQPWNPVKNNIFGTMNLIDAARYHNVERFVFVSTDKAVRPTNVMGASKRVTEILIQNQCGVESPGNTRFVCVRFGNVVGSAGSVVPLFKKQIEQGGPVTVTHPEVTRYFMMIPEACQLILQAGGMGNGGEIFILDMGQPVCILDMARDLIRLSGFIPDEDIKITFTGLRAGEKLYEELITEGEGILPTTHEKILVLKGTLCDLTVLSRQVDELGRAADVQDADAIRRILKEIIPEYQFEEHPVPEQPIQSAIL